MSDSLETTLIIIHFGALIVAAGVGRLWLKSSAAIWGIALLAAGVAMVSSILIDGQGAFLVLIYAPVIYAIAAVGRYDLK